MVIAWSRRVRSGAAARDGVLGLGRLAGLREGMDGWSFMGSGFLGFDESMGLPGGDGGPWIAG